MQTTSIPVGDSRVTLPPTKAVESAVSAVSWPAIIAGAVAIVAVGLILLALGSGVGLSSISPWPNSGTSATTFGVYAAVWLVFVQWLSAAFGGYLTGRLRTKWVGVHTDEVYFRDTAPSWTFPPLQGISKDLGFETVSMRQYDHVPLFRFLMLVTAGSDEGR
jgi:hypothetical protein